MHKKYFAIPEVLLGFDTETTGLDVGCERAISYGFWAYERGRPVWSEHFYVRPDRPISPGAQRVHGVSMDELEAKYQAREALSVPMGLIRAVGVLREYLSRGASIVGANVTFFDIEMLRRSYASVLQKNLLDDLHVVPALAQLAGDPWGDHLVEQQPHASACRRRCQRSRSRCAIAWERSIQASISSL